MQYRMEESTGTKLSVLGYGCMRFPRTVTGIDMKKAERLVMEAVAKGVNYFDTAYIYPGSEAALGCILEEQGIRDKVCIATKLPFGQCEKDEDFDRIFSEQLARLRTDFIDFYLVHNINRMEQWETLCRMGIREWIARQKETGRIRRIGFSFHGACAEFLKILDAYEWDFCQIQYNYSDENYQAGVTGLRQAAKKRLPVIIMEPLLGGKLVTGLPKRAEAVFRRLYRERTMASWGLRWLLDQPEVTVVLSGMNRDEQVRDNVSTADEAVCGVLSDEERDAYKKVVGIFKESYRVPCTGCGYCMPCPRHVNIPGCFAAYNTSYAMGFITGLTQYIIGTGAMKKENQTAGRCVQCKACQRHCPQNIAIHTELKAVRKRMEPFYLRAVMEVVRRIMR